MLYELSGEELEINLNMELTLPLTILTQTLR